MSVERDS